MRHIPILVVTALALVVASPLDVEKLREKIFLTGIRYTFRDEVNSISTDLNFSVKETFVRIPTYSKSNNFGGFLTPGIRQTKRLEFPKEGVGSVLEGKTLQRFFIILDENTRSSVLEELFINLIEELRVMMVTGSDLIPVLDPFELDEIRIDQNTVEILPGYIAINDLKVDGLSTFVINDISITMVSILSPRIRFILDASIPLIDVNVGQYDLDLTIFGGSIFGNGDMRLRVTEPRVHANVLLTIDLSNGIFLNLLECRIGVSLRSFDPEITGMFNDPVANDFVNAFLKKFVEEFLVTFEDEITDFISDTALEYGNRLLADLDLASILGV